MGIGFTVGADAAATVTVVVALEAPPQLVAVSVRLNVVETATWGAVQLVTGRTTLENVPPVAVQAKAMGCVPMAPPVMGIVCPELAAYGPPVLAAAAAQVIAGITLLGQGLSCPTNVPADELYPPWARKLMVLKLFSGNGVPGMFSGKMYCRIGAWYWP